MTTPAMVETLQLAKEIHVELERLRKVEVEAATAWDVAKHWKAKYMALYEAVTAQLDEEMPGAEDDVTMAALRRIKDSL
jgi:hypothetical protein